MRAVALALSASVFVGCVARTDYETAVADARRAQNELAAAQQTGQAELQKKEEALARCQKEMDSLQATIDERERQLSKAGVDLHNLQAELDQSTSVGLELRRELERLGKNVDQILEDKGELSHALEQTRARLDELRKTEDATETRNLLYKQLIAKFKSLADTEQLRVAVLDGRLTLQVPSDVLFDPRQATLRGGGRKTLERVAGVLKSFPARKFQVSAHTDNVSAPSKKFASNWELSVARAVSVVRFLTEFGVSPEMLSAAGYGGFDPINANDTPDKRAMNRRVEIVLVPSRDELAHIPDPS